MHKQEFVEQQAEVVLVRSAYEEGMEAKASCFIVSLSKKQVMAGA